MKKKQKIKNNQGICKLTKKEGAFVKSHIIPQAFTQKIVRNEPFHQPMENGQYKKYWTSWYDPKLVIREGEDILAELDSWAATTLRRNKLVWGVLDNNKEDHLKKEDINIFHEDNGLRTITNIDTQKLRRFCLSLLWRSAATELPEFDSIQLPNDDLERLRRILISEEVDSTTFYPSIMMQFSTIDKGDTHITAPFKDTLTISLNNGKSRLLSFFRFYFNGLIIHIYASPTDGFGKLNIGSDPDLYLLTKDYYSSREKTLSEQLLKDYADEYIKNQMS